MTAMNLPMQLDGKTTPLSLNDVREALEKGDKAYALQLLTLVLHRTPSADAWYLAAKLTTDDQQAIAHLHRALFYDPHHGDALTELALLGAQPQSPVRTLTQEIMSVSLQPPPARTPADRLRQYGVRIAMLLVLVVVVVFIGQAIVGGLFRTPATSISAIAPSPIVPTMSTVEQVTRAMLSSPIIERVEPVTDGVAPTKQVLRLYMIAQNDAAAEIWIYDSIAALVEDRAGIEAAAFNQMTAAHGNVVLFYQPDLEESFVSTLLDSFNSLVRQSYRETQFTAI